MVTLNVLQQCLHFVIRKPIDLQHKIIVDLTNYVMKMNYGGTKTNKENAMALVGCITLSMCICLTITSRLLASYITLHKLPEDTFQLLFHHTYFPLTK